MTTEIKIFISLLLCFLINGSNLFSQKNVTWKGGSPGRETQWQFPGNWSGDQVPDEFSNVIIPDISTSGKIVYPIINDTFEINALRVEGNAQITITTQGLLLVSTDVFVANEKSLKVHGDLTNLNRLYESNTDTAKASCPKPK